MLSANKYSVKIFLFRHIFVYHDDPQTVVNWYHAIRCCKLHLLQVGFPSEAECELLSHLSQDYIKEGLSAHFVGHYQDVYDIAFGDRGLLGRERMGPCSCYC